jgi:hypothetical protein
MINILLEDAEAFLAEHRFPLPRWAFWGPKQWKGKGRLEVVENMLGWDVTDYGEGDFEAKGLLLFTLRNGNLAADHPKPYAEKIMVLREGQLCPLHFHWSKMEDIINRGGGDLVLELWASDEGEGLSEEPLEVSVDGVPRIVEPGGEVVLTPGESITLAPGVHHRFYARGGKALIGEVSSVNDDNVDNRFFEPLHRFPEVEEDEPPRRLLVTDYPRYV